MTDIFDYLNLELMHFDLSYSDVLIRPPGTLVPKAFCFSRDVLFFFNQTQDL